MSHVWMCPCLVHVDVDVVDVRHASCACTRNKRAIRFSSRPLGATQVSSARRSSPLAPLEEGLKSKGVSVRVAHTEAEEQEAGEHARHRPDGEHAQVVHADARHVERAEGARAVPRQPVARLVGVAELVEYVVPERGDRGVLRGEEVGARARAAS